MVGVRKELPVIVHEKRSKSGSDTTHTKKRKHKQKKQELNNDEEDDLQEIKELDINEPVARPAFTKPVETTNEGQDASTSFDNASSLFELRSSLQETGTLHNKRDTAQDESISASIRDRIRSRILKAKNEAVESQGKVIESTGSGLKSLRTKSTHSGNELLKEDIETENAYQEHVRSKSQWKKAAVEVLKRSVPSVVAYDFFTRTWEDDDDVETDGGPTVELPSLSAVLQDSVIEESQQNGNYDEEAVMLHRELFANLEDQWDMVKHAKARYVSLNSRLSKERNFLFVPSKNQATLIDKFGEEREPHFLEEDGFYVGRKPFVTRKQANIVENRFIIQQETKWFDDDGTVQSLPNPLSTTKYHFGILNKEDASGLTVYRKAVFGNENQQFIRSQLSCTWYQLDIDISAVIFHHHPLFSKEHVLCSQLTALYKKYAEFIQNNSINHVNVKLKALRAAVNNLKESPDEAGGANCDEKMKRLEFYQEQLRAVRQLRDSKMAEFKNMESSIILLWQEIKALRQSQGYNNTSVKLKIQREPTDQKAEEEEFEKELAEEFEEEYDTYRRKHERFMKTYSKQKGKHAKRKQSSQITTDSPLDAAEHSQRRRKILNEGLQSTDTDDSNDEPERLVSPEPFNEEIVKQRIREKALLCYKQPGEPKLLLELSQRTLVTPNNQCPRTEQQRRSEVSKRRIMVKVMFNNKEACKTTERSLTQNFMVSVGQIFNLRIIHWPETLCLQIYEGNGITNSMIAELYLPLPEQGITLNNLKASEYDFSSEQFVSSKFDSVGSGVQFSVGSFSSWLLTDGILRCRVAWGVDDDEQILGPSATDGSGEMNAEFRNKFSAKGLSDIKKLKEWAEQSQLDPNDPENVSIFQALEKFTSNTSKDDDASYRSGYFRLDPLNQEFNFSTTEDILKNSRFRLLLLRSHGVPEFRNYHMVPLLDKEIPSEIFQAKSKLETPIKAKEGLELQREKASRMLKKLWQAMMRQFQSTGSQRALEDIIVEDQVPSIGSIGFNLVYFTRHRRPLYPIRKERKKVTGQNVTSADVKIIIQIRHAMNVPVRTDTDLLKGGKRKPSLDFSGSQVHPFVEVMFQRETAQTDVAEGPQPTWNQELHLPFRAPDDNYTPSSLQKIQDKIYLNLFDEVTVDLLEDDRDRETTIHQRLERHWLGNLKIPFSTLYLNSKIEGTFCLNVPPVLLGYGYEEKPWKLGRISEEEAHHTYLSVFLTIEPSLQLPETIKEQCISEESENLMWKADQWQKNLSSRYSGRQIKTVAVDLTGRWVFVTRYIKAIQPPEEILNEETISKEEKLARFISLIPTRSDSIVYHGICDIWTTCDHFLQTLIGDEEEHAILLCNYFLFLRKTAFLLLGEAIPEGPTAYVLTMESPTEILVWNATTGEFFNVKDSHSPLRKVGCLMNSDNIWANVQKSDHPSQMNFDLSRKQDWKPFFTSGFRNPGLKSIQPEQLIYTVPDREYIKQLQKRIENILKESIMKWRKRFRTSWNRFCIQALRKTLPKLEQNGMKTASMDSLQELEEILVSYKMTGFPLCLPYTDIGAIVEAVFATGVHQVETKNAEFALAVYLHSYPCNVLAVWIYVATMTRIR